MNKFSSAFKNCLLFSGIRETDLEKMLNCLSARQKHFKKNSFIFIAEDKADSVGIVLTGAVHVLREDYWGKRKIVTLIKPGGLFGEAFACAGTEKLPISVMAAEESEILFLDVKRIIKTCSSSCIFHTNLIKNLTLLLAKKNVALIQKLEIITQPTTREKLMSYLSEQARLCGNSDFSIPFNREELADYLSVERSAMSAELSKMQKDGLVSFNKNHFALQRND